MSSHIYLEIHKTGIEFDGYAETSICLMIKELLNLHSDNWTIPSSTKVLWL